MNTHQALKAGIQGGANLVDRYLGDLSDADLLVRAIPGTNHIAWQLGHLIAAENMMIEGIKPGSMPKLPEGFAQRHNKKTAGSDVASDFLTKAEYLELFKQQRAATLAALESFTDAELDAPAPPPMNQFLKTVGHVFAMQGTHWVMHAGQWALVRRKLGHPPMF